MSMSLTLLRGPCYPAEAEEAQGRSPDACGRSGTSLEGPSVGSARGVASAAPFFIFRAARKICVGVIAIARPLRVNEQIRIRSVRVIDENGEQLGIMPTEDALSRARGAGLDLIEISPNAQPPVVKIGDFGRLKYEQSKKDKDARKKQRNFELKEVKLRPKIETHDYETKARMAERLLMDGSKIKVTIMFRGREITYTAFGRRLLDRMAEDMEPLATVEREPRLEGKNMFMILAPRTTPSGPPKFSSIHDKEHHKDRKDAAHVDEDVHEDVNAEIKEPTSA
jgi:translation initiation factor IF-3